MLLVVTIDHASLSKESPVPTPSSRDTFNIWAGEEGEHSAERMNISRGAERETTTGGTRTQGGAGERKENGDAKTRRGGGAH